MKKLFSIFSAFATIFSLLFISTIFSLQSYAATTSTLLPVNDGFYAQWTPKSGSTHYTMVDETPCNGQTDYNSTTAVNNRDSYGISVSSIPNGSTITQVDITPCASKNLNGGANSVMDVFYRLGGVDSSDAGSYSLSGITPVLLSTTSFTGISTVKSSTTTLEIGAVLTSGTKGARLSQISTVITYTPLSSPSSLMVSAGTEAANLSWTDNASNEDGFKIERSTDSAHFTQIDTVGANVTTYVDPNVIGTYYYRVRAYNSGGDSSYSNIVSVSVPLAPPSDLAASPSGSDAVLTWTDNSLNEDGFVIYRSSDSANFFQIKIVGVNSTGYTDPGLVSGTYYYKIRAFKNTPPAISSYSNTASVIIP